MVEISVSRAVFNSFLNITGTYFEGGGLLSQRTGKFAVDMLADPKKLVDVIFERMLY